MLLEDYHSVDLFLDVSHYIWDIEPVKQLLVAGISLGAAYLMRAIKNKRAKLDIENDNSVLLNGVHPKIKKLVPLIKEAMASNGLLHNGKFKITSAFRSKAENDRVGGARASYHLLGQALDIRTNNPQATQTLFQSMDLGPIAEILTYEDLPITIHIAWDFTGTKTPVIGHRRADGTIERIKYGQFN